MRGSLSLPTTGHATASGVWHSGSEAKRAQHPRTGRVPKERRYVKNCAAPEIERTWNVANACITAWPYHRPQLGLAITGPSLTTGVKRPREIAITCFAS